MNVSIVIPVFNQLHFTRQCLACLEKEIKSGVQVVIVNNASSDGTAEFLANFPGITVISNAENRGCAAAWNQGVQASTGDWIVILNNDVLLPAGWLEALISFAGKNGVDVACPAFREGELNYEFAPYAAEFVKTMRDSVRKNLMHGICFAVHRRVFEKIGLFDENFRIGQFEDSDFFRRARLAGFKLATTGSSFLHHFGSATQNAIRRSKTARPYEAENREYFRKKWKLNWLKRRLERAQEKLLWHAARLREFRAHGHSLNEKWVNGKLRYH